MKLDVSAEIGGEWTLAGIITGDTPADARFCYEQQYLLSDRARAISMSLPLREEPFSPARTRSFFDGLLPEGFTRRTVSQWMHVESDNYLSILHGLGRECLGALRITKPEEELSSSYEKISPEEIRALAAEGVSKSSELVTKAHLSLTGASGKVGLYHDPAGSQWYLPRGAAPSTHIVKQSHVRLNSIVTNEQLSLRAAARCGIEVPESFIVNTGSGKDDEILFAVKRYDRIFPKEPQIVSGLPCPLRLHQEDFAQAMGLFSSDKYEKTPAGYMQSMFDLLRRHSRNPLEDQMKLWDRIVFNYLIGNTDAHLKNTSLLYDPNLDSASLAPAYDLVSTAVYEQSTREMAFFIGGSLLLEDIDENSFRRAAREIHLSEATAIRHLIEMRDRLLPALKESAAELSDAGYPMAEDIASRILQAGGIRQLL